MWNIAVKYVNPDPRNGNLTYRRRVPEVLKDRVNKSEFIKVLGKTQAEALRQYGVYHAHVEHLIALAKGGVTGLSQTRKVPYSLRHSVKAWLERTVSTDFQSLLLGHGAGGGRVASGYSSDDLLDIQATHLEKALRVGGVVEYPMLPEKLKGYAR